MFKSLPHTESASQTLRQIDVYFLIACPNVDHQETFDNIHPFIYQLLSSDPDTLDVETYQYCHMLAMFLEGSTNRRIEFLRVEAFERTDFSPNHRRQRDQPHGSLR